MIDRLHSIFKPCCAYHRCSRKFLRQKLTDAHGAPARSCEVNPFPFLLPRLTWIMPRRRQSFGSRASCARKSYDRMARSAVIRRSDLAPGVIDQTKDRSRSHPVGRSVAIQFSKSRLSTRSNSPTFAVTRIAFVATAWAAIQRSFWPIGMPRFSREALMAP